jgi:hypothetical protein
MRDIFATMAIVGLAAAPVWAQPPAGPASAPTHDTTELAKQTQNPVSDLISVPVQFNFYSGGDLEDRRCSTSTCSRSFPSASGRTGR